MIGLSPRPRRPRAGAVALAGVLATVTVAPVAMAQESSVLDVLTEPGAQTPSRSAIDDSIGRLEPEVGRLELPEPRSLREERDDAGQTTVSISADVLFPFDSAEVTDSAREVLAALATELEDTEGTLAVVGHTDSVGTDDYNQQLSEDRAAAVADVLREHLGDRDITTEGRSFHEPLADEDSDDPSAAARNRRVEISFAS